jgi:hypothetical protein
MFGAVNRPPGFGTRHASAKTRSFVARKTNYAIRGDHIHGPVRQADVLDLALEELDVFNSRFALVLAGKRQHRISPIGLADGTNSARG